MTTDSNFRSLFTDTRAQFDVHCFKLACEVFWSNLTEEKCKALWEQMPALPTKCEKLAVALFVKGRSDARLQAALADLQQFGEFRF